MKKLLMAVISGEVLLKSPRTRPRFEERLLDNIVDAFERNNVDYEEVWIEDARLLVDSGDEKAVEVLRRVFGIQYVMEAWFFEFQGLEDLAESVERIARDWVRGKRFAVRPKRTGKHDFTSLDIGRVVGAKLYPYSSGVDLSNPDVEVFVEVRGRKAYVYREKLQGPGGLPIGVEGRALVLFSGGFDSPVAAWLTAKRGVEVDLLHYVLSTPQSYRDARSVAEKLASDWLYGYKPVLRVVDFRPVTAAITGRVREDYALLVLRTLMLIHAERIARSEGYDAIVTGESLGQVSSQTLRNIRAINSVARTSIPVLRPLIGMDKEEIVQVSRRIGLYEYSSKTREYCRLGRVVTTRADPELLGREVEEVEHVLDAVETVEVEELVGEEE